MLVNTENKNIFIHNYDQEILPTLILAFWLFIILSLTLVYMKEISTIQYKLFTKTTIIFYRRNTSKPLKTTMLSSLVIHKSSVTAVQMEDIANMKCYLHQFHFEQCFIQKKINIYVSIYVPLLQLRYICWDRKNRQH